MDVHNPNVVGIITGIFTEPIVDQAVVYYNDAAEKLDTSASRIKMNGDAAELYYGGSKVSETTANGITGAVWG